MNTCPPRVVSELLDQFQEQLGVKLILRFLHGHEGMGHRVVEQDQVGEHLDRAIRDVPGDKGIFEGTILEAQDETSVLRRPGFHLLDAGHPATHRFVNAARLAAMNSGAIFYNIGRGTTVDQEALLAVLQSGHLGAAYLDVTNPEPLPRR